MLKKPSKKKSLIVAFINTLNLWTTAEEDLICFLQILILDTGDMGDMEGQRTIILMIRFDLFGDKIVDVEELRFDISLNNFQMFKYY